MIEAPAAEHHQKQPPDSLHLHGSFVALSQGAAERVLCAEHNA